MRHLNDTKLCAQLWNGAVVDTTGKGAICCEMAKLLNGTNIKTQTLSEFKRHADVVKIKEEMLAGKEPIECKNCFDREKHGVKTLRNHLNNDWHRYHPNKEFDFKDIVENLELRFGDLCQLQCAMCHPHRSKKIRDTVNFIHTQNPELGKKQIHFLNYDKSIDTSWVEDEAVFEKILNECTDLKRLFLNGGEPLLAKTHNQFLNKLINRGISKSVEINYSTNILLVTEEHFDMWSEFKWVNLSLSLDDLYDRNRFIRYPSNWDNVVEALNRIYKNRNKYKNVKIDSIWRTLNSLNFCYTLEFFEFFKNNYPDFRINMRGIQDPDFLNPIHLPQKIKDEIGKQIIEYCNQHNFYGIKDNIRYIIDTVGDNSKFYDSLNYYRLVGQKHNINIDEVFKNFFSLLSKS